MNREIKFRYWNGYAKAMYPAEFFGLRLDGRFLVQIADEKGSFIVSDWNNKDALMQFTGLTDKNRKEIYEGDIVRWNAAAPGRDADWEIYRVVFEDASFRCKSISPEPTWYDGDTVDGDLEVIGNIYENPELLK